MFFLSPYPAQLSGTVQVSHSVSSSYPQHVVCCPCEPYKCRVGRHSQVHLLCFHVFAVSLRFIVISTGRHISTEDTGDVRISLSILLSQASVVSLSLSQVGHTHASNTFSLSPLSPAHLTLSAVFAILFACICVSLFMCL